LVRQRIFSLYFSINQGAFVRILGVEDASMQTIIAAFKQPLFVWLCAQMELQRWLPYTCSGMEAEGRWFGAQDMLRKLFGAYLQFRLLPDGVGDP